MTVNQSQQPKQPTVEKPVENQDLTVNEMKRLKELEVMVERDEAQETEYRKLLSKVNEPAR